MSKIEVTFDLDANGILNVFAKDISSGNGKNITIKNDKGRLSQKVMDRMVEKAERYKEEDGKQQKRIASRNYLEGYIFSLKQAAGNSDEKLSSEDKNLIEEEYEKHLKWLDNNTLGEKEELEDRYKQLSATCGPIMMKLHEDASQASADSDQRMPSSCGQEAGDFGNSYSESTIEEVD